MRLYGCLLVAVTMLAALPVGSEPVSTTSPLVYNSRTDSLLFGPAMTVDPSFTLYREKPLADTAAELRRHGITSVRIIYTRESSASEQRRFADVFRSAGLATALQVYPTTDVDLDLQHPEWRQVMLDGSNRHDWRMYGCPNHAGYAAAYCERIRQHLKSGAFDGLQLGELWFEQWGGPEEEPGKPRAKYACVCAECSRRFRTIADVDAREMLTSTTSRWYWRNPENRELYEKWVDMRVDTTIEFARAIMKAARETQPGIRIGLMSLADATVEPGKAREYQAQDFERLVRDLHPDWLVIQDAWQDWLRADLPPDFVKSYGDAYVKRARRIDPGIYLMSHADIGSHSNCRRSWKWLQEFSRASVSSGFDAPVFYEWSISSMARKE